MDLIYDIYDIKVLTEYDLSICRMLFWYHLSSWICVEEYTVILVVFVV